MSRPETSIAQSSLFTEAVHEPQMYTELKKEIASADRMRSYVFYLGQPWNCSMYGEYIGRKLIKFTRKSFPLSHKKEDAYIGGLSMGGFGARHAKRPEISRSLHL